MYHTATFTTERERQNMIHTATFSAFSGFEWKTQSRVPRVTVNYNISTCEDGSWSLISSVPWDTLATQFCNSLFFPHSRMYNPAITVIDPSKLLIIR